MGMVDSKIKKKGRQIVVLSENVKKLITKYEDFLDEMKKQGLDDH